MRVFICQLLVTCKDDLDCKIGEECRQNECVTLLCKASSQCPGDKVCANGKCINPPRCSDHNDCQPHPCTGEAQICMQHKPCKPKKSCEKFCKPNQCSSHSDCPIPGMACIGGKCQPFRIEKCIQNCKGKSKRNKKCKEKRHQCEGYELCVKGYCLPRTCWNNGRCKKGYTCTDGICRPHIHTQCEHSNECKHKEKCIHGKCVGFCLSHQDCQAISKVCYNQKCIQPPRCHQENEGKPCKGKNVPRGLICQDGICIQIEIKECRNDDECRQGWFCRNDVCIFSCRFHYDCPGENQICTSNGCVDNVCKEDHIGNICGQLNMICEKNKCQRPCLNVYECPSSEFCALGICKPMK